MHSRRDERRVVAKFVHKNRTGGSNQQCGSLTFLAAPGAELAWVELAWGVVARRVVARGVVARSVVARKAALGVFLWLEVLDFDLLSFLCWHFIFLSGWFVLCQWRRRAIARL